MTGVIHGGNWEELHISPFSSSSQYHDQGRNHCCQPLRMKVAFRCWLLHPQGVRNEHEEGGQKLHSQFLLSLLPCLLLSGLHLHGLPTCRRNQFFSLRFFPFYFASPGRHEGVQEHFFFLFMTGNTEWVHCALS